MPYIIAMHVSLQGNINFFTISAPISKLVIFNPAEFIAMANLPVKHSIFNTLIFPKDSDALLLVLIVLWHRFPAGTPSQPPLT